PRGDPRSAVCNLIRGPWRFAAVHALVTLGVFGHLAAGPLLVPELAACCGADPAMLERLLRCAAGTGLLAQPSPGCYALTSDGRVLVPGAPGSMHPAVLATGEAAGWQALTGLAGAARTGQAAFTAQQGHGFYDYLAAHPAAARIFAEFMTSRSADVAAVIAGLDFTDTTVVADIGGGHGTILAAILAAHPHLHGILFDRSHVLAGAHSQFAAGVAERTELAAGDYLDGPLPPAGTYLLANILHNHNDADARVILGNIRAATPSGPRIVLADILLPSHPAAHIGCDLDVRMMALGTGRERTRAAYLALLGDVGFTSTEIIGTPYGLSIIDARPTVGESGS
ncbi:MAG: methyltransferase, partial [Streptosporangiaceae bacterium]